jgi:Ca2+-binding RTX toxin-like protein
LDGSDNITVTGRVGDGVGTDQVIGGAGDDDITVTGSGVVDDGVEGRDGNDNITVSGHIGDGNGNDNVVGNLGDDTLTITSTGSVQQDVNGNNGNDTITVDGVVDRDIIGGAGSDSITVSGTVGDDIDAGPDGDTVVVTGTIAGDVDGGLGIDNMDVGGTVGGSVLGGTGADTMNLSGIVGSGVNAGDGDDAVTLLDGVNVAGIIDGGNNIDSLTFDLTTNNEAEYLAAAAIIASNASSGSIAWNGNTLSWQNFESLVDLLELIAASGGGEVTIVGEGTPWDHRCFDDLVNMVVYCNDDGSLAFYRLETPGGDGLLRSWLTYEEWASAAPGAVLFDQTDAQGFRLLVFIDASSEVAFQLFGPGSAVPRVDATLPELR